MHEPAQVRFTIYMNYSWVTPESRVWNWLNLSTVLNTPEKALSSEYALIYMNVSTCARILNLPESAEIYPNMGKHA